ncbi:MAG: DUF4202 family protein [Kofleriaceae bacterium]|nr:DUF4202 family protein [Kofleriaceae bacterium]
MSLEIIATADATLTAAAWRADTFDFWAFDRHVDLLAARGEPLCVVPEIVEEVALRTQRLVPKRNGATEVSWFTVALAAHRVRHDTSKPLVLADLDHAIDSWQWALRLDPQASAAVQLATLFHDIERLVSEADTRIEQHAADYQAFKDAHARAGAMVAREIFDGAGVPQEIADEAFRLVETHERAGPSDAVQLVNDADALSFFSLNSPGYLAYFGPEQTAKKVAYTLARMSDAARHWLSRIRIPAGVLQHA